MNYVIIEPTVFKSSVVWKVTDNGGLVDISMIQASAAANIQAVEQPQYCGLGFPG
jgi:hypothetical protein